MNKLTRKECEQACLYLLSHCYEVEHNGKEKYTFTPSGFGEAEVFKLLIEEHFDNPPLKFEELKEGMWVWDNKEKEYAYIYFIGGEYPHLNYINGVIYDSKFEENRFYRREVQDEH